MLIVTKPRRQCVETLCKTLWWARNRVLFRFTIGSSSDGVLGFWEPRAPTFGERLRADEAVIELYKRYANDPLIKWKESIKKVVGIEIPAERGLDK